MPATAPTASRLEPLAGSRAVFTGRVHGNVSLPLGGGDPVPVRRALAPAVGVPADRLVFMEQVHGPAVAVAGAADAGRGLDRHAETVPGVDALVTAEPGLGLVVLTADCLPVLFAAPGVVAAAHAGRAGLLAGVLEATVRAMGTLGAAPERVVALIGPAIGPCCYELPEHDVRDAAQALPAIAATSRWGTPSLDLQAAATQVLRGAGVARVGKVHGCTRCAPDQWFSHRAATDGRAPHGAVGRQASVVALTPDAQGGAPDAQGARSDARGFPSGVQWLP